MKTDPFIRSLVHTCPEETSAKIETTVMIFTVFLPLSLGKSGFLRSFSDRDASMGRSCPICLVVSGVGGALGSNLQPGSAVKQGRVLSVLLYFSESLCFVFSCVRKSLVVYVFMSIG